MKLEYGLLIALIASVMVIGLTHLSAEFEKAQNISYSGFGVELSGKIGYELLRSSTIRLFVQADIHHPFYKLSHKDNTRKAFTRPAFLFGIGYTPKPSSSLFWFLPF